MSLWFAANAVASQLGARWNLSDSELGWLTTIVQLGFVVGTATSALFNLADILPARRLFAGSALVGALANALLLAAPSYQAALACRFFTGFALAGVYPPAMKMISTWFRSQRGLAVGTIVGALTVGKAGPYLVHAIPGAGETPVVLSASIAAVVASLLVMLWYSDGPYPFPPRPFSWSLVATVFRERRWRLATGGYLGHMFELYSAWTWLPVFVAASTTAAGMAPGPATNLSRLRSRSRRSRSAELVASGADAWRIGADVNGLSRGRWRRAALARCSSDSRSDGACGCSFPSRWRGDSSSSPTARSSAFL